MLAIAAIPLILSLGFAIDFARYSSAKAHLQNLADSAALAAASANLSDTEDEQRKLVEEYISGNLVADRVSAVRIDDIKIDDNKVDVRLTGVVDTTLMGMVNPEPVSIAVSALAMRAVTGSVEVVLVLDNTWSMSEKDANGVSKIQTLKNAASALVSQLITTSKGSVSVGLVPYADYVNVGINYRNEPWLSVPSDYSVPASPKVCEIKTTKSVCLEYATKYACTNTIDGVEEPAICGGSCIRSVMQNVSPYQSCSGGGNPTAYKWYGCVGSRTVGTTRLNDQTLSVPYPGYVETSQKCLNPIVPLIRDKAKLLAAISGMIINIGNYKPYTYIPAGLIWGVNLLSPTDPFDQGDPYDSINKAPRKALVLMTDGENTLRFNVSNGRHVALSTSAATAATQLAQTNSDTSTICDYAKAKKVEIFTVAFMVDSDAARALLQKCATDLEHYFDASDSEKLMAAFGGIARSLSMVRLAR